jgi:hypothetical protein
MILIALLAALPAAPALAGDPFATCCLDTSPPPSRSGAKVWFRSDSPERHAIVVARGPGADTQGFVAASGLTADVGDGCGPVSLRPRGRVITP